MAYLDIPRTVELTAPFLPEPFPGALYTLEDQAHRFIIATTRNRQPEALDGQITALFIRPDGGTVELSGTLLDGVAYVALASACYTYPGRFSLTVFGTGAGGGAKAAIYACVGSVLASSTDVPVDPGSVVPDVSDIVAEYENMQAAARAAYAAAGVQYGLVPYNSYDVVSLAPVVAQTVTHNGITFTWGGTDTYRSCSVTGTSTGGGSQCVMFPADTSVKTAFPFGMEHGKTYRVEYSSSLVRFDIWEYDSGGNFTATSFNANGTFTLKNTTVGVRLRLYVTTGTVISSAEVVTPRIVYDVGYHTRGYVADGADLNTVVAPGYHLLSNGRTYTHAPVEGALSYPLELEVLPVTVNTIMQRVSDPYAAKIYTRVSSYSGGAIVWNYDWVASPTKAAVDAIDQRTTADTRSYGILPSGDLNSVTTPGYYLLNSTGSTYSYTNLPYDGTSTSGQLEVMKMTNNTIMQRVTVYKNNEVYIRQSAGGLWTQPWKKAVTTINNTYNNNNTIQHYDNSYTISCSPTITTDTNNYLQATGDTTDRTGDIQTMLNTTGVCRLGPGDFYVTGVEVPTFGMLIGSGAKTRVILAASVTNGYAVKLGNYSSVKDMRIAGATSNYTPVSTIGNRHGVLFEATATAESSPTYKNSAMVDGLWIVDFAGGGITCSATGQEVDQCLEASNCYIKRCDAGIYIPILSEFHHFTNMNVTHCYHGCVCNGGNCLFTNCNFSHDIIGVEIGSAQNNAHGVFSACKIAHSGASNDGVALKVDGSELCENFNGISFDYGQIVVTGSKGLMFSGCRLGRGVSIDVTGSQAIIFNACIIRDPSQIDHVTSTNSTTRFVACYDSLTGNVYDPLA